MRGPSAPRAVARRPRTVARPRDRPLALDRHHVAADRQQQDREQQVEQGHQEEAEREGPASPRDAGQAECRERQEDGEEGRQDGGSPAPEEVPRQSAVHGPTSIVSPSRTGERAIRLVNRARGAARCQQSR